MAITASDIRSYITTPHVDTHGHIISLSREDLVDALLGLSAVDRNAMKNDPSLKAELEARYNIHHDEFDHDGAIKDIVSHMEDGHQLTTMRGKHRHDRTKILNEHGVTKRGSVKHSVAFDRRKQHLSALKEELDKAPDPDPIDLSALALDVLTLATTGVHRDALLRLVRARYTLGATSGTGTIDMSIRSGMSLRQELVATGVVTNDYIQGLIDGSSGTVDERQAITTILAAQLRTNNIAVDAIEAPDAVAVGLSAVAAPTRYNRTTMQTAINTPDLQRKRMLLVREIRTAYNPTPYDKQLNETELQTLTDRLCEVGLRFDSAVDPRVIDPTQVAAENNQETVAQVLLQYQIAVPNIVSGPDLSGFTTSRLSDLEATIPVTWTDIAKQDIIADTTDNPIRVRIISEIQTAIQGNALGVIDRNVLYKTIRSSIQPPLEVDAIDIYETQENVGFVTGELFELMRKYAIDRDDIFPTTVLQKQAGEPTVTEVTRAESTVTPLCNPFLGRMLNQDDSARFLRYMTSQYLESLLQGNSATDPIVFPTDFVLFDSEALNLQVATTGANNTPGKLLLTLPSPHHDIAEYAKHLLQSYAPSVLVSGTHYTRLRAGDPARFKEQWRELNDNSGRTTVPKLPDNVNTVNTPRIAELKKEYMDDMKWRNPREIQNSTRKDQLIQVVCYEYIKTITANGTKALPDNFVLPLAELGFDGSLFAVTPWDIKNESDNLLRVFQNFPISGADTIGNVLYHGIFTENTPLEAANRVVLDDIRLQGRQNYFPSPSEWTPELHGYLNYNDVAPTFQKFHILILEKRDVATTVAERDQCDVMLVELRDANCKNFANFLDLLDKGGLLTDATLSGEISGLYGRYMNRFAEATVGNGSGSFNVPYLEGLVVKHPRLAPMFHEVISRGYATAEQMRNFLIWFGGNASRSGAVFHDKYNPMSSANSYTTEAAIIEDAFIEWIVRSEYNEQVKNIPRPLSAQAETLASTPDGLKNAALSQAQVSERKRKMDKLKDFQNESGLDNFRLGKGLEITGWKRQAKLGVNRLLHALTPGEATLKKMRASYLSVAKDLPPNTTPVVVAPPAHGVTNFSINYPPLATFDVNKLTAKNQAEKDKAIQEFSVTFQVLVNGSPKTISTPLDNLEHGLTLIAGTNFGNADQKQELATRSYVMYCYLQAVYGPMITRYGALKSRRNKSANKMYFNMANGKLVGKQQYARKPNEPDFTIMDDDICKDLCEKDPSAAIHQMLDMGNMLDKYVLSLSVDQKDAMDRLNDFSTDRGLTAQDPLVVQGRYLNDSAHPGRKRDYGKNDKGKKDENYIEAMPGEESLAFFTIKEDSDAKWVCATDDTGTMTFMKVSKTANTNGYRVLKKMYSFGELYEAHAGNDQDLLSKFMKKTMEHFQGVPGFANKKILLKDGDRYHKIIVSGGAITVKSQKVTNPSVAQQSYKKSVKTDESEIKNVKHCYITEDEDAATGLGDNPHSGEELYNFDQLSVDPDFVTSFFQAMSASRKGDRGGWKKYVADPFKSTWRRFGPPRVFNAARRARNSSD